MAVLDPRRLMQAAMRGAPQGPAPVGAPGTGGVPAGPQGGMQDALPGELAGAQPVGAENSGVLSTAALQNQMGVGAEDQTGQGVGQMIQAIQDPNTPPDQKRLINQQLQLAALRSLTAGPTGAVGTPQG